MPTPTSVIHRLSSSFVHLPPDFWRKVVASVILTRDGARNFCLGRGQKFGGLGGRGTPTTRDYLKCHRFTLRGVLTPGPPNCRLAWSWPQHPLVRPLFQDVQLYIYYKRVICVRLLIVRCLNHALVEKQRDVTSEFPSTMLITVSFGFCELHRIIFTHVRIISSSGFVCSLNFLLFLIRVYSLVAFLPVAILIVVITVDCVADPSEVTTCFFDRYAFNGLFSRTTWVSRHQKGKR